MELSKVEISSDGQGTYKATVRGDVALGEGGYFVAVTGWGLTEDAALSNLATALGELQSLNSS